MTNTTWAYGDWTIYLWKIMGHWRNQEGYLIIEYNKNNNMTYENFGI
jgi:hypothetical protein